MTRNIYALLVGIDQYLPPVAPLRGCVNDITAFEEYLQSRVTSDEDYQLHLLTLKNQQATRQAIIDGFRTHLSQANRNDIVLFYYSGHGSQEPAPPEFWHLEPNRLHESLVCWDSRQEGGWDLADKELAKLISEVAKKDPHITIIMDCCHSGSGTRNLELQETGVRRTPANRRSRPIESFILDSEEISNLVSTSRSPEQNPTGWMIPRGRHVLLAACRDCEEAKEYYGTGQHRGAFCYFLLDTLQRANGSLTYRDVFKRTNALVRSKVASQSPQLEATNLEDLDQPFLGGAIAKRTPYFTVSYHQEYGWIIDGGAVHGIAPVAGEETTRLALFAMDSNPEDLRQISNSFAEADVTEVLPQVSKISCTTVDNSLDVEKTFKAVVTSLPMPPLGVCIEGEEAGVKLAREALQQAGPEGQASMYVGEVETAIQAEFRLIARNGEYIIARPTDDRPLVAQISGYNQGNANLAIARLEHIARWTNIAELSSPASSRIDPDAVEVKIYQGEVEIEAQQIRLEYKYENGKWQQPTIRIKLINRSDEPLYCALLDLTETYAILTGFFASGGVWLQPGECVFVLGGNPIYATVPKELWEQGVTEFKDVLKLIVSTAEFDATLLEQERLDAPRTRAVKIAGKGGKSVLNRLMNRVQTRDLLSQPEKDEVWDDWVTSQITFTTVRPQETTPIPQTGEAVSLGAGVEMRSHPSLKANARLTTIPQATRDVGNMILPPILRDNPEFIQSFQFTASRGTDPGLSALELSNVEDAAAVTPEQPLELIIDAPLAENEALIGIGYDGEFFVPAGLGKRGDRGQTEIKLDRLPDPVSSGSRSLGGSVRIFFQKVALQKLGYDYEYPILAIADLLTNDKVSYEKDIHEVREWVAKAQRILLFTHSILGDTQKMVPGIGQVSVQTNGEHRPLSELYDLVLTFDYESINTPIEENARSLKHRLELAGLGANHGKVLHIVAQGMGGLVARWFIEQEQGNRVVQHLVLLGPPNGGSPWATVQSLAKTALLSAINGVTAIAPPVKWLSDLLLKGAVEAASVSLEQMQPGSEFLKKLAASPDPQIPYTVLAGNQSIQPAALAQRNGQASTFERMMQKAGGMTGNMAMFGQPNDITVSVASMTQLGLGRKPQISEVGCDHFSYLSIAEGLEALAIALSNAPEMPLLVSSGPVAVEARSDVAPVEAPPVATPAVTEVALVQAPPVATPPAKANVAPVAVSAPAPAGNVSQKTPDLVTITVERHWLIGGFAVIVGLLSAIALMNVMLLMRPVPEAPKLENKSSQIF
ncbi:caspase family protein [Kamptonema animale CS-326]|jgi:hypothetical protein|uniref:caspase family protein n=1 Tax=Kamptonema animale TaxID=92934 RepID=UPI00232DBAC1|nr:caspase family protein [Kamptonema animale]MDB9511652.1 caspase family protein [Kamptonema animale CS-326]